MSVSYYYLNSVVKMRRRKSVLYIVYNLCPQEFLLYFLLEVFFFFNLSVLCCSFRSLDSWFCVSMWEELKVYLLCI